MYWFFAPPGWGSILWLLSMLCVLAGGWLAATHLFRLESRERVLVGAGIGLVSYLWTINWIGRVLPPFWTFLGAAVIVLLLGISTAYPFRKTWLDPKDLRIGGWIATGLVLLWIFLRISKGTGLFDEYKNLALISTLANGYIPAIEHFGGRMLLRYHYGFHFFGAGMTQLAHLAPWSAFDLSKSIVWSLSLLLAGLVGARILRVQPGAVLMAAAVALAGGTRYLLLLLPSGLLGIIEAHVRLIGIAYGPLAPALASTLPMEASPQIGYPFAFLSGISPTYVMAHGGEQTIEPMLLMLTLLILRRSSSRRSIPFFVILFSFWALASETSFVLIAFGMAVMLGLQYLRGARQHSEIQDLYPAAVGLVLSIPLVLLEGGVITAIAQRMLLGDSGNTGLPPASGLGGFTLRWPPAIVSGQLGLLPLADPWAVLAGIFEMGIIVVMLPWMAWRWWQSQRDDEVLQLLLPLAWMGLLIPLFVEWTSDDANITHITDFAVDAAVVALILMLAGHIERTPPGHTPAFRVTGAILLAAMGVPGIVLLGVELTAAQTTVLSEHYGDAEAGLLQQAWGRLPRSSKVLGTFGAPSILTGQLTAGIYSLPRGNEREVWGAMLAAPRLDALLANDFDFVFVNSRWWNELDPDSQLELRQPCISVFARGEAFPGGPFAEILDLRGCR